MSRFFLSLLLAGASFISCAGQGSWPAPGPWIWQTQTQTDECAGFLICQNFEGVGYDNSETWTVYSGGTRVVDEDYTTVVLRGDQSLSVSSGASDWDNAIALSPQISGTAHVYGHFLARLSNRGFQFLRFLDASDNEIGLATAAGDDTDLRFYCALSGGSTNYGIPSGLSYADTVHVWFEYVTGTGANARLTVFVSSGATKPATSTCSSTDGTSTANLSKIAILSSYSYDIVVDQFLVSQTPFDEVAQ